MLPISHGHGNHFLRNGEAENVRTPIKFHRVFITRQLLPASSVRKNKISGWVNPHIPRGIGKKSSPISPNVASPGIPPLLSHYYLPVKNRIKEISPGGITIPSTAPGEALPGTPFFLSCNRMKATPSPMATTVFKEVNLPNSLPDKKAAFHPSENAEQGK
ncbi:MAG: hypothetical protein LUE13_04520 [Akkermansiaceae bacterium]|nr:hypothetical protein [Akkermansiaceae bacterium]